IHLIAVAGDCQRQGIGSAMIIALQDKYHLPLEAETVEEAIWPVTRRCHRVAANPLGFQRFQRVFLWAVFIRNQH
ncbi:MAG: GNAT family N-acetyltransferase, partial [Clostridiales Family XIII bacterium]|nr:GNAT family N-acetyltransferase [Clostridiales Family XIII bacterium]